MAFDRLDSVGLAYLWGKLKAFFATKSLVGDTTMGTTATTVTGAIKEHNDLIGSTTMGTTATTLTGAIAEHESDINDLNSNLSNVVTGTNYQPAVSAHGAQTSLSVIYLDKGIWLIGASGYCPIPGKNSSNNITEQPTMMAIYKNENGTLSDTNIGVSLTFYFNLFGIVNVPANNTRYDLAITNWEDPVAQAGKNYQFKAIKLS